MTEKKEEKLVFYPISLDYIIENKKPIIRIFSILENKKKAVLLDDSFRPYFYAEIKNISTEDLKDKINKIIDSINKENNFTDLILEDIKLVEKKQGFETKELFKITINIPKAIPILAENISKFKETIETYERDIKFIDKYLMDKKLKFMFETEAIPINERIIESPSETRFFEIKELKQKTRTNEYLDVIAFDIETYSPRKDVINPEKYPILMISLYGDFKGKIYKKVLTWKKFRSDDSFIEYCKTEQDMIERFIKIIREIDPTVLTGYFSSGFDLPYLLTRAKKYKIKFDIGTDSSVIKQGRGKNGETFNITGIEHIDAFKFVKRMLASKMETNRYDLNSVSDEFFGEGKYDIKIDELHQHWDNHSFEDIQSNKKLAEYAKYNLKDSELTYKLCKKIIPTLIEFSKLTNLSIQNSNELGFSQLVEHYLMEGATERNILIPKKPHHDDLTNRFATSYEGAFVYKPTPGLYKNIIILDFKSMYPTIISSHNISPETFDYDCEEKDRFYLDSIKNKDNQKKNEKSKTTKKHWFCQNKPGIISGMIDELIDRRARIKKMVKILKSDFEKEKNAEKKKQLKNELVLLEGRQEAMKLLSNSITGYLGFYGARWYSLECISNVLMLEREYIQKVISEAEKRKLKVIYSDTDSIFIAFGDEDKENKNKETKNKDYKKEGKLFSEFINSKLPDKMDLEFEGYFPKGIFVSTKETDKGAKKKYALMDEKENIVIKGFEAVRSNWSPIAKEVQVETIRLLLKGDDKKAIEYIKSVLDNLKNKKISPEKLIISTRITKQISEYASIGPHVAVAKRLEKTGIKIVPGMSVSYIITEKKTKGENIGDRAEPFEEKKEYNYDYDYYAYNQIIPAIDKLIEVFGYSKDNLEKKEQSNLGSWIKK